MTTYTPDHDTTSLQAIIARLEADIAAAVPFAEVQPGRRFRFIGVGKPTGEFVKGGASMFNYYRTDGSTALHGHASDGDPVVEIGSTNN